MSAQIWSLLAGIILAAIIAIAAWRVRSLSAGGALAAGLLGAVIFGLGGLGWALLLLAFFISSSALSRLFRRQKSRLEEKFSKGAQRDAAQVAANGGVAGLLVLLHLAFPAAVWPWLGFAGALAAANADTWATELGVLSRSTPRLITTGKPVERGTSGGISTLGVLAAFTGALLIALLAVLFWQGQVAVLPPGTPGWLAYALGAAIPTAPLPLQGRFAGFLWIGLAGLGGSLVDSFLGATVQAIYVCPVCQKETERHPLHSCGVQTRQIRGWGWMDNDWVNTICTLSGAVLALLFVLF